MRNEIFMRWDKQPRSFSIFYQVHRVERLRLSQFVISAK